MSLTCLSVVSETIEPIRLNEIFNSPSKNIGQLPSGALLETTALKDFGINNNEYCASPYCLENVTSLNEICGLILHECQTGKMIDYQVPAQGISCEEDGTICINLSCWKVSDFCPENENDLDPFLEMLCDPCKACQAIEALILKTVMKQHVVSWSFGGKSITLKNPNTEDLYQLLCIYQGRCEEMKSRITGCPQRRNSWTFKPSC